MLLELDFESSEPIYQQIRNQIVLGIADGRLAPGQRLPTIRALANEAGVNMMTVNKAYALLRQEGLIETDRRHGVTVCRAGTTAPADTLAEKPAAALRLAIAEAKLAGMSRTALLALCARLYDEGG